LTATERPRPSIGDGARIVPRDPATRLRLASSGDGPFIVRLFKTARADDFAAAGLPQAALEMLLEQQFRAQSAGYAAQFPDAASLIVLYRDEPVGRLILLAGERSWHVVDILLVPSARGRGIGTDIIEAVVRAAAGEGACEVALSVLFSNAAARRLYARLGFAETGEGVYIPMAKRL
jgi:GNAT superfamily N-acetyltransferase